MFQTPTVPTVSAAEALRLIGQDGQASHDPVLLDVRELAEWNAGHAPEAVHVPLSGLAAASLPTWSGRRVLAICRSGSRSRTATSLLRARGVDAVSVDGGMGDWAALGGRVVTAGGVPGRVA